MWLWCESDGAGEPSYLMVLNEPQKGVDLARGWLFQTPRFLWFVRRCSGLIRTCHLAARLLKWITSISQSAVFCGIVLQWHSNHASLQSQVCRVAAAQFVPRSDCWQIHLISTIGYLRPSVHNHLKVIRSDLLPLCINLSTRVTVVTTYASVYAIVM